MTSFLRIVYTRVECVLPTICRHLLRAVRTYAERQRGHVVFHTRARLRRHLQGLSYPSRKLPRQKSFVLPLLVEQGERGGGGGGD